MTVNIDGVDKAELLAALHNGTRALGLGQLQDIGRNLTVDEAREVLARAERDGGADDARREFGTFPGDGRKPLYFDYLFGRPLKVDLSTNEVREDLYDRDAPTGQGTFAMIVAKLRRRAQYARKEGQQ